MPPSSFARNATGCAACRRPDRAPSPFCPRCGARLPLYAPGDIADGRYRIVELLALGPCREVYRVARTNGDEPGILKVFPSGIAASPGARARFREEARLASRVRHPNVASVDAAGIFPDGSDFIVREHVPGEPLDALLERAELAPDRAVGIAIEVLDGLDALHGAAIVHGDVAPDNVIVMPGSGNRVKLIDLGIAEETSPRAGGLPAAAGFRGKPRYASPEQRARLAGGARTIDERSDIFSAGSLLAEMLGAEPPTADALPGTISPDLADVVRRSLEEDPAARFADAAEFREALRRACTSASGAAPETPGKTSRRPRRLPTLGTLEEDPPIRPRRASRAGMTYVALSAACVLLALLSLAFVRVMSDRRGSADSTAGPLSTFAAARAEMPPAPATPRPSPPVTSAPEETLSEPRHPAPAQAGRSRAHPSAAPASRPAMGEAEAARRLAAALRARDYYRVSPECLRARAAGYREAGYTFDVVSKGCGFFRPGETLGRWRIDGRTGEALVQNARGRFVRPG